MKKLKVLTVVGTRPEVIRLSRVLARLDEYCEHVLVHTGQNYDYELNQIFFDELDIRKPDLFLSAAGVPLGVLVRPVMLQGYVEVSWFDFEVLQGTFRCPGSSVKVSDVYRVLYILI